MRNKKADLSLSTNAIVVLIIAITILGLALGFTRSIFNNLGKKIGDVSGQTKIDNPPTIENPMTLTTDQMDVRKGDGFDLKVGFFNHYDNSMPASVRLITCLDSEGNDEATTGNIKLTIAGVRTVDVNAIVIFAGRINVDKATPTADYACTLVVDGETPEMEYKDLLIKVN
jgi:hypothetical protein